MIRLALLPLGFRDAPHQYAVNLRLGDYAILSSLTDGQWQATVFPLHHPPIDRGRFASARHALRMLEAELNAAGV